MLDTNFLLNMEEHLPVDIASNMELHKHKQHVKYVGRGVIQIKGKPFYQWIGRQLNQQLHEEDNTTTVAIDPVGELLSLFTFACYFIVQNLNGVNKLELKDFVLINTTSLHL